MHVQIAEVELGHSATADVERSVTADSDANYPGNQERPLMAARGIVTALIMAVPFWMLFAFTLYLLI
jgi:hypothetical protein